MTHGNPWKLLFLKMLNQTKTNYLRKLGFLIQTNSECRLQFGTFVFFGFLWHPNMSVSVKNNWENRAHQLKYNRECNIKF